MKNKMIRDIVLGALLTLVSMFLIAFLVAKIKYPYYLSLIPNEGSSFSKFDFYVILMGFGFFGNILWYGLFWYLKKEYLQRGVLLVTVIASMIFILNKLL